MIRQSAVQSAGRSIRKGVIVPRVGCGRQGASGVLLRFGGSWIRRLRAWVEDSSRMVPGILGLRYRQVRLPHRKTCDIDCVGVTGFTKRKDDFFDRALVPLLPRLRFSVSISIHGHRCSSAAVFAMEKPILVCHQVSSVAVLPRNLHTST